MIRMKHFLLASTADAELALLAYEDSRLTNNATVRDCLASANADQMPFPNQVNVQPGVAVAGDFASTNPRYSVDAGPGGLVAGPAGVTVGRFAWATDLSIDTDNAPASVANFGTGMPTGFVHREQQGLNTIYLAESSMFIPHGFPITLMSGGDFWVVNSGTTQALVGQYAFANFANGLVTFAAGSQAAIGTGNTGAASVTGTIAAGSITFSGYISGNILTVTGSTTGTIVVGGTLTGGTGTAAGTQIISQLTGTPGGVGTYALNIPEQTVNNGSNSVIFTETYGVLNVTGITGVLGVGDVLSGTGIAVGTTVTALGTGSGGTGTYILNITQTVSTSTWNAQINVQTKWIAMSSGLAGELVKISNAVYA